MGGGQKLMGNGTFKSDIPGYLQLELTRYGISRPKN